MISHTHSCKLLTHLFCLYKCRLGSPSKIGNFPCRHTSIRVLPLEAPLLDEVVQRADLKPGWPEGQEFPRRSPTLLRLAEQLTE
ncbi:hypothetical protein [African swine fever virus]|nr:hypothetical protein [African swine fever virus]UNZ12320.1 ASF [African swine fever virus]